MGQLGSKRGNPAVLDREAIRRSLEEAASGMHARAKILLFKAQIAEEEEAISTALARLHLIQIVIDRRMTVPRLSVG